MVGDGPEASVDDRRERARNASLGERVAHEGEPPLGGILVDDKWVVASPEPGMPKSLRVDGRASEPLNEEQLQFGPPGRKVFGIDGPEDSVVGDAVVEEVDNPFDRRRAANEVEQSGFLLAHVARISRR